MDTPLVNLLVDGLSKKDLREGSAAAQNIVPSSTGAAIAVSLKPLQNLQDSLMVYLFVCPFAGSIVDITFISKKAISRKEVNEISKKHQDTKMGKNFSVTDEPLVSSDILGESYAPIADLALLALSEGIW